jgi:Ca-activated chloride channel family protein
MLRLENIHLIYTLALIPVCFLLFLITRIWKKKKVRHFGEAVLMRELLSDVSKSRFNWRFTFFLLALCSLIITVLNPQSGSKLELAKRKGAQIIIALDVSNSMKAEDLYPNRLERAKQAISQLIDNLKGDEIGLVVFAGKAYVQLPLTTDYAAAKLFLDNIDTDIVPTQGTSLGSAIDLGVESFSGDEKKNKALIIITDGEDHEGGVEGAAAEASKKGIVIHTIGMGSADGVPIPSYQGKIRTGYKKDKEGSAIITKLNESVLKDIAASGHGLYIHASNSDIGLNSLLDEINKLDKTDFESKIYTNYDDYFPLFAGTTLILLIIEGLFSERKSKWYERIKYMGAAK